MNKNEVTTVELMKFIKRLSGKPRISRKQEWMLGRAHEIITGRIERAKKEFNLV